MRKLFIILFLSLLLIGCRDTQKAKESIKIVQLSKMDEVVLEQDEHLFGRFYEYMKVSPDGKYWLFNDRIRGQIFVFNNNGSFHSVVGKRGKGPDELLDISSFDINHDNRIAIIDLNQRMFKSFTIKGDLISSHSILEKSDFSLLPNSLSWYGDKLLGGIIDINSTFEPHKSRLLALINSDGSTEKVFAKVDPFSKEDNRETFTSLIVADEDKDFVYTNLQTSPYFQIFNLASFDREYYGGKKTENFKLPKKEVSPQISISKIMELTRGTSSFAQIFLTDEYFIQHMQIMTAEWFETSEYEAKQNVLVFYERNNHKFVKELILKDKTPVAVYDDQVYMVENFNPDQFTIGIHEIVNKAK